MVSLLLVSMGLCFFIIFLWYIMHSVTAVVIDTTYTIATEQFDLNNTYINGGVNILLQIEYWWGPLLVIAISVLWVYVAAQGRDWRSSRESF